MAHAGCIGCSSRSLIVAELQFLYTKQLFLHEAMIYSYTANLLLGGSLQVGVLNWFARLWEINEEEYWGYITNCGTEGNLHGILVGRENYPDGILYASRETHYSVFKAARMYRMDAVKVGVWMSVGGWGEAWEQLPGSSNSNTTPMHGNAEKQQLLSAAVHGGAQLEQQ
jgi:hypothetical protein